MEFKEKRRESAEKILGNMRNLANNNNYIKMINWAQIKTFFDGYNYGVDMTEINNIIQSNPHKLYEYHKENNQLLNIKLNYSHLPGLIVMHCDDPEILYGYLINILKHVSGTQLLLFYKQLYFMVTSFIEKVKNETDLYDKYKSKIDDIYENLSDIKDELDDLQ